MPDFNPKGHWCDKCAGCTEIFFEGVCHLCTCEPVPVEPVTILQEAQAAVFGARQGTYGHPRDDFARTAQLWDAYLEAKYNTPEADDGFTVDGQDVACMMVLLKMARLMNTPDHRDSIVDMAGYAETLARVVGVDD